MTPKVSIIMGSTSDLKIMEEAAKFFDEMEIPYEINALSAHRVPELVMDFAKNAHKRGIKVVIAGAGGAAHLPGVIAALTPLPVIGIPIKSSNSIDGWDSILSILRCLRVSPWPRWRSTVPATERFLPHKSWPPAMKR